MIITMWIKYLFAWRESNASPRVDTSVEYLIISDEEEHRYIHIVISHTVMSHKVTPRVGNIIMLC